MKFINIFDVSKKKHFADFALKKPFSVYMHKSTVHLEINNCNNNENEIINS